MSKKRNIAGVTVLVSNETYNEYKGTLQEQIEQLQQENKQLKEKLENKIDLYEDTISYQLGFDKGKEELQQALLDIKEYIKEKRKSGEIFYINEVEKIVNKALGDKENE